MTKLIKYDPFDFFPTLLPSTFLNEVDEMFRGLDVYNPDNRSWSLAKGFPKGDAIIEEDRAVIELALAGYKRDQLSVQVEGNKITVSAQKCEGEEDDKRASRTLARRAFTQEFFIGKGFDLENSEVTFENGLLQIVVPKVKPEPKVSKELTIK